jgi:hypothetical protein
MSKRDQKRLDLKYCSICTRRKLETEEEKKRGTCDNCAKNFPRPSSRIPGFC